MSDGQPVEGGPGREATASPTDSEPPRLDLRRTEEKLYICPGETHPITRSVHLARLAAFYPACRECPFRTDTGHLPRQTLERLESTERRIERISLFTAEGVRGIYLNELTRREAERLAEAFAALLWREAPVQQRPQATALGRRPARPTVVVGYDERPASPDLVTGVVRALRRMGCQVIDIALTTKPAFCFAVDHLQSGGGIYVTGAGCDPSWTGLDFVGRGALPLSRRGRRSGRIASSGPGREAEREDGRGPAEPSDDAVLSLDRLEARFQIHRSRPVGFSRPTRQAGPYRTFQASIPYEAGLWKHLHALRAITVCCGCPSRLARGLLQRLFDKLPCTLRFAEVPDRVRDLNTPDDPDVQRLSEAVRATTADVGVLIDDDACRCAFLDERGEWMPPVAVARLIAETLLAHHPGRSIVVEPSAREALGPVVEEAGGRAVSAGPASAEVFEAMRQHEALFGGGASGRFWFGESTPRCDAVLALARVLEPLNSSEQPLSELVREPGGVIDGERCPEARHDPPDRPGPPGKPGRPTAAQDLLMPCVRIAVPDRFPP